MKLYCLGSGSRGNCYLLENSTGEQIVLDAGINVKDIAAHLAFTSWRNVVAALITHEHKDHSKSLKEIARNGINCFGYFNLVKGQRIELKDWIIQAFECAHDAICLGFAIKNLTSNEILVYATDTTQLPIVLNADFWLVECNYDEKTLNETIQQDEQDYNYLGRVSDTHMGLDYLTEYFKCEQIKRPKVLIACHLSENNTSPDKVLNGLRNSADFIDIAKSGKEWNL